MSVEQVYLHCAKALIRAGLWDVDRQIDRASMPSFSRMLFEQMGHADERLIGEAEADYAAHNERTLY